MIRRRKFVGTIVSASGLYLLSTLRGNAQMIEPQTPTEQMMYTTVRIVGLDAKDQPIQTGTGFFYHVPLQDNKFAPILITNKHVIEGAESLAFVMHTASDGAAKKPNGNLTIKMPASVWIGHPHPKVDLCGAFVAEALEKAHGFTRMFDPTLIPDEKKLEELSAVEEVLMVGYPNGLWDAKNNFPLIRKGITASHPAVDYIVEEVPTTVVDIACFPGSSGSPIILHNSGSFPDKKGNTVIGTRTMLLGVLFAGPVIETDGQITIRTIPTKEIPVAQMRLMMNLGYIIKAKEIIALSETMLKKVGVGK